MSKVACIFVLTTAFSVAGLHAAPIQYAVSIDTSGVVGLGFLDFQFSAGGPAQDLFLTISGLNIPAGQLAGAQLSGDVTGSFPGSVTMSNIPGFSDVSQLVWSFPSTVTFVLTFSGPALDNPDPGVLFGTKFGLGMMTPNYIPLVPPTDIDGFNVNIDIGPRAYRAVSTSGPPGAVNISEIPEPATLWTAGFATLLLLVLPGLRRRNA